MLTRQKCLFCAIYSTFRRICKILMCTFAAPKHSNCRIFQACELLHIRKTELVVLCWYMHCWSSFFWWTLSWFTIWIKEFAFEYESTHIVIQKEILASWKMSPQLNSVLQAMVKIFNHIKVHTFNSCLLVHLCEEVPMGHTSIFLDSEVRWFSKGRSLVNVFKLCVATEIFSSKTVTIGIICQWHNMSCKMSLLLRHIEPD